MSASGRDLLDIKPRELLLLYNARYGRLTAINGNVINESESAYTIWWGMERSRTSHSGSLAMKNLSSPTLALTWSATTGSGSLVPDDPTASTYEILVFHEYWSLCDINGADGSIRVGTNV